MSEVFLKKTFFRQNPFEYYEEEVGPHSESIVSFEDPSGFSPSGFQPSKPISFSPNFRALEETSRPVCSFLVFLLLISKHCGTINNLCI